MKSFRATWSDGEASVAPELRVVSRSSPPRPQWSRLYLALIAVLGVGAAAHVLVHPAVLVHVMDAGFALLLFSVLVGWVRFNRTALTRLDEPGAGAGRPSIRIVRSRPLGPGTAPMNDGTARLDPDERVVIPLRLPMIGGRAR